MQRRDLGRQEGITERGRPKPRKTGSDKSKRPSGRPAPLSCYSQSVNNSSAGNREAPRTLQESSLDGDLAADAVTSQFHMTFRWLPRR